MNLLSGAPPQRLVLFVMLTVSSLLAYFAFSSYSSTPAAAAPPPTTMNFQGRLANSSNILVADGLYNMQFRIFTVASGGSAVWTETRETTNRVQVTNGLFSVQLGSVTPLSASVFNATDLYFEITMATPATANCSTASCASWESPMTPRNKLATSAYAYNAATLNGFDETDFAAASGSTSYIQNGTSPQTANFNITGTGTAATLQAATFDRANSGTLTIGGTNATSISLADDVVVAAGESLTLIGGNTASRPVSPTEGMVYFDTETDQLLTYANGKWQADRSTATVIVGTSASGGTSSAVASQKPDGADFVNSSDSSAETTINSAITSLPATGGTVYLMEGTYVVDGSILVPSNVTLMGAGSGTIIKIANTVNANLNVIADAGGSGTEEVNITVKNLTLEGNKANNSSGTQRGVYMWTVGNTSKNGVVVDNIISRNFRSTGIYLDANVDGSRITNSNVSGNTTHGVFIESNAEDNVVSDNTISANGYGVRVEGHDNIISNNTIRSNTSEGLYIFSAYRLVVKGNNISGNTLQGVYVWASQYSTVSGNVIISNGSDGINTYQTTNSGFSDNVISSNGGIGITVRTNSNNSISSNNIVGNTQEGIYVNVSSAGPTTIENNRVENNGGSGSSSGVRVRENDNSIISNNFITDTAGTGHAIHIDDGLAGIEGIYLSNNVFSGTGATTILDNGTNTIYANQSKTAGGLDTLFKQVDSASSFQIQNATGTNMLNVNTTDNQLTVGTADSTGVVLVLDTKDTTGDPTGVDGAMYYNSFDDKFRCYQNGGWTDCIGAGGGGATTALDNLSGVDINAALNATGNNLTLQTTTSGNVVLNAAGTIELQSDTNITGDVTIAAGNSLTITGGNTASRPASPTEGMVYYDTDTKKLLTYANGKWQADRSTTTKIVAASNSSQALRDAADYVADGTSDQTEINAALTAAAGGKVYLAEGTYVISAPINIPTNTILSGAGETSKIQLVNSHNVDINMIDLNSGIRSNVTVQQLSIDGNKSNQTAGVQRGIYAWGIGSGTGASATKGLYLQNIAVSNMRSDGILIDSSDHGYIEDIKTYNNSADGLSLGFSADYNHIENVRAYGNTGYGIEIDSGARNSITGSYLNNNSSGLRLRGSVESHSRIVNNSFVSNTSHGVIIDYGYGSIINSNQISYNGGHGVFASGAINANYAGLVVGDNTVNHNTSAGIKFDRHVGYATISGNRVFNNGAQGISLEGYLSVENPAFNTISGNHVYNNTGAGIHLHTADNNTVDANNISNSGGSTTNNAIQITGGSNSSKNSITNNTIADSSATSNNYAISIASSVATTYLSGNVFSSGTISDAGTGTIYANQSLAADAQDVLFKQANSAIAFQIQNATGVAQLTAETNNSRIQIGSSTTDATAIVFALDNYNQASDPTGVNGAMYYNTDSNKFRCYEDGAWADCITQASAGAATDLSNLTATSINQTLTPDTNNSIDIGSSGTRWRSGYFGTSLSSPVLRPAADGTSAFTLQNSAGTLDYLTLNTTNNRLTIGTADTTGVLLVLDTKTNAGDPTGVAGAMYYNSSLDKFRCYEGGAWKDCIGSGASGSGDDTTNAAFRYSNELLGGNLASGDLDISSSGTGAGTYVTVSYIDQNRPGMFRSTTGSTNAGRSYLGGYLGSMRLGGGSAYYETAVYMPNLSYSAERYTVIAGFMRTTGHDQQDAVAFVYDQGGAASGSGSSANWQLLTADNNTRTWTTTSTAVSASTWYKLGILVNEDASSVGFYIDGTLVGTHTTNIPSAANRQVGFGSQIHKSSGTSPASLYIDYIRAGKEFTTSR